MFLTVGSFFKSKEGEQGKYWASSNAKPRSSVQDQWGKWKMKAKIKGQDIWFMRWENTSESIRWGHQGGAIT